MQKIKNILYVVIGIIISLLFPLFIKWFLFSNNYFSSNNGMEFTRETWFGFIGSYLGAIGTVILGIIALYQNKKYKEFSDKTEETLIDLQKEIKELNKKNVELIEISTKIERAKYHPTFLEGHVYKWTSIGQKIEESFFEDCVFQIIWERIDNIDPEFSVRKIFDNYNTFIFLLQNKGEKSIRNFNCNKLLINGKIEEGWWLYRSCDIEPGGVVKVIYATKTDLIKVVNEGYISEINLEYSMENVLDERFYMDIDIKFYNEGKDIPDPYLNISGTYQK